MTIPQSHRPVRWLLIGAGDIATRRVGPALCGARDSQLVAVCDVDRQRASLLAARLGVAAVFSDVGEALERSGADAVYIATPQATHVEMCFRCLDARLHFLCEKPIALNGTDGLRLLRAARGSGLVTSCSDYRRLSGQYRLTESMLHRGELGRLFGGWAVYSTPFYNPGGQPATRASGASRIKELGYYLIDIAHNLFGGMPSEVMAMEGRIGTEPASEVEDVASVILRFGGGELFTIIFNSRSPGTRHELELFGERCRVSWRDWPPHGNGPVQVADAQGQRALPATTDPNWHLPMIEDYVEALRTGRQPVCSLESAVKTEVVTDAVFRSIASGRCEPVIWEARP